MYTCDAFGLHYCTEDPFDTDVDAMLPHYRCDGGAGVRRGVNVEVNCWREKERVQEFVCVCVCGVARAIHTTN
jgi:hypothetical protein